MAARGVSSRRFVLGYSPAWTSESTRPAERDIDIVHLGTADERRLRELAPMVAPWAGRRTELVLAPHEPMTEAPPDFVTGWRSAISCAGRGCCSTCIGGGDRLRVGAGARRHPRRLRGADHPQPGLAPLVPGEHVLVADPARLGRVALAALADPELLGVVADAAYERCRVELDMVASAAQLLDLADEVATGRREAARSTGHPERALGRRPAGHPAPSRRWRCGSPRCAALPQPAAPADRSAKRLVYQLLDARAGLDRRPLVSSSTGDATRPLT